MISEVIAKWAQADPALSVERIAVETSRSAATVRRWMASDAYQPRLLDLLWMERLRPGLLAALAKAKLPKRPR